MQQAVILECGAEAQVRDHDNDPGDEARDGADVDEPVEHRDARVGHVEVRQQREHPCEEHRDVRDTVLVGAVENLGRLACQRHRIQHTRAGVQEGVTRRPGGCQDGTVDGVVEAFDAGRLDANNEGTCGRVTRAAQLLVIGAHDDADDEGCEAVEDRETPHEALGGLGDVAARVDCLTRSDGDQFGGGDEGEAGLDEGVPVGQKFARFIG